MSHVYKDTKDLLSVIIDMGKYKGRGNFVLWHSNKIWLGRLSSCLKIFTWQNEFWSIWQKNYEGTLWRGPRAIVSFIFKKQIFLYFYRHGDRFYDRYINKIDKTKYLDDDGSGVKPKHFFIETGIRRSPCSDPAKQMWDRDR